MGSIKKHIILITTAIIFLFAACNSHSQTTENIEEYSNTSIPWLREQLDGSGFQFSDYDIALSDRLLSSDPEIHTAAVMELENLGVDGIRVLFLWKKRYRIEICCRPFKVDNAPEDAAIINGMHMLGCDLEKYLEFYEKNIEPTILNYDKEESISLTHYFNDKNQDVKVFTISACSMIGIDADIYATALINTLDNLIFNEATDTILNPVSVNVAALIGLPYDTLLREVLANYLRNNKASIRSECGKILSEYLDSTLISEFVERVNSAGDNADYVQELIRLINDESNLENKCIYLEVLSGFNAENRIIDVLASELEDLSPRIRETALKGLYDYGGDAKEASLELEKLRLKETDPRNKRRISIILTMLHY